jgi:hypothetical protein
MVLQFVQMTKAFLQINLAFLVALSLYAEKKLKLTVESVSLVCTATYFFSINEHYCFVEF